MNKDESHKPINIFDFDGTPIVKNENGLITGIGEVMTDDKRY